MVSQAGIPYEVVPLEGVQYLHPPNETNGQDAGSWLSGGANRIYRHRGIHEIVVCYPDEMSREELASLAHTLLRGIQVSDFCGFVERTFFKVPVEQLSPDWFFQINTSGDYALYRAIKRLADLILATSGIVLAAPVMLLAAILIKLESPGPIFYSQIRMGRFRRPFKIWKLRSMRRDSEENGPQWARENDVRVTRVGRLLRATRLDEVPQFVNVLRGEMSFVGPRPERPEFVDKLAEGIPFYDQRHLQKPGVTGWAQINYPYGATVEDALNKLEYDLYYVKHASLLLDLQILLRTVGAVMKGAR
jgi:exopolysaccharide biosynthesis polyprenyl glycosylphosphotransferase